MKRWFTYALCLLVALSVFAFQAPEQALAAGSPTVGTITYTTAPLYVNETETVRVTLNESTATSVNRSYYVQVLAVRTSGTFQVAAANVTMPAGSSSYNYNFNVTFNTAGSLYTKVKVFTAQGGTLLTERQGTYADEVLSATTTTGVPYYDQYDNYAYGGSTCNLTSIAMVLDYYKITKPGINTGSYSRTPDYLLSVEGGPVYSASGIDAVFNDMAVAKGSAIRSYTKLGTKYDLRNELATGRPVIVQGWYTSSGHVMVVMGFDGTYYTANDPAGKWNGSMYGTFSPYNTVSTKYGKGVKYAASNFDYASTDPSDGKILFHYFR